MDKLPPEILHGIFIQLDFEQRLVCTLVCRSWWSVLDRHSLFYSIELKKDKRHFKRFMDMFDQTPDRAAQVEKLDIELSHTAKFNRRKLVNIFPNARVVNLNEHIGSYGSLFRHYKRYINISHSKSKLEYLSDFYHCELACQVINSKLGDRLKTLCLNIGFLPNTQALISQLKDLPLLEKLCFQRPNVTFHDLETIHKNIPSVQDFSLQDVDITADNMPSDILPATTITRFMFKTDHIADAKTHSQFYQYLTKKYTGITDIKFQDQILGDYASNNIKEIYLNGVLDFYKLVGPSIRDLTVDGLPGDIDPFDVLDKAGSKIKIVNFRNCEDEAIFQYLSRSNQFNYVKELHVINTNFTSILPIRNMKALTKLFIAFYFMKHRAVCLADCLTACPPSLKTLVIHAKDISVNPFNNRLDFIETLEIEVTRIPSHLGDIISSCFPNLVNLTLKGEVTGNVQITLKNPHFRKVTLYTNGPFLYNDYVYGIAFKSSIQTETHYYIRNSNIDKVDPRERDHVEYDDVKDLPLISVELLTAAKLELGYVINITPC